MQKQNDLAENLLKLFDPASYKEFGKGFFVNQPNMEGYYYIFQRITDPKFCLIVNTSEIKYPSTMANIKDYVFIIFSVPSMEEYFQNFTDKYFIQLMEIIDQKLQKKNTRNLPYGYYMDENGQLQIDIKAAGEVRRIYDMYIETQSIRYIANKMRTNFSDIREILHDNEEYLQMQQKIIPVSKLKQVNEIMAKNVRGGATAKRDLQDEIEEVRRMRKNKERMKNMQQ